MNQGMYPNAIAIIKGGTDCPGIMGLVGFYACADGVTIEADISGLPQSESDFMGFHIHEGETCAGEGFSDTKGHFNPTKAAHPFHAGDLPPLLNVHGKAYMKLLTNRFQIGEIIGKTVVIHREADDFRTQPAGNAGHKIACGVIRKV